jgi:3-hydroxyisobutyrate dehydrogenase-like beta-hydroxyacid dehydrogenase
VNATVGVVGLGEMGGAFVERLLDAGRPVIGWNRTRAKAEHLIARGMSFAASPAAVAAAADVVITMVTDAAALDAVTDGPNGLLTTIGGKILVEMTTCAPTEVIALAARVRAAGGELVDAAVLGSTLKTNS